MSFVLSFISLISTAEVQCSASPSPSDSALPLVGILRALHKHAMIHDSHFAARRHTQPHIVRLCDLFKEWIGKGLRLQQVRHLKQELVGVLKPEEVPRNCWYVWTMRARDSDRERQTEIEREREHSHSPNLYPWVLNMFLWTQVYHRPIPHFLSARKR